MTIRFSILLLVALGTVMPAAAADWITAPSYYTHDPYTAQRVQQYAPIGPFYSHAPADFQRSGYRHFRSSIQAGESADHYHQIEEWGRPVRPYGEWRFPYRPHSVPYDLWAPPVVYGGYHGYPHGHWNGAHHGTGGVPGPVPPPGAGFRSYPGYTPQPWDDGRYPPYDSRGPYGYPGLAIPPAAD